jgi:hypothetical protein
VKKKVLEEDGMYDEEMQPSWVKEKIKQLQQTAPKETGTILTQFFGMPENVSNINTFTNVLFIIIYHIRRR